MKHAKILSDNDKSFNWNDAEEAMNNVVDEDGEVNWRAAFFADPGVTKCLNCGEFFWHEAELLECTECGTQWNTYTKEVINITKAKNIK